MVEGSIVSGEEGRQVRYCVGEKEHLQVPLASTWSLEEKLPLSIDYQMWCPLQQQLL